jgi:[acyl-carrier-protein] S-malonyltransferase
VRVIFDMGSEGQLSRAWLFPGQGAQKVGMGAELARESSRAREIFERADEALGYSISRLCFEGPTDKLLLTENGQPAILTMSIAALEALKEAHPELPPPDCVAGHSLGEYSALVAVGALSLEDAVRVVHARGKAMQEAVPAGQGGMAAIMGGDAEAVESLCRDSAEGDVLSPANFNAPAQIVIAGTSAALARALRLAKERSMKAIALEVSAPFHCTLMAPATECVRTELSKITISEPIAPVFANINAEPTKDPEKIGQLLVRQVEGAVLWDRSIRAMREQGVTRALEIGPGKVLSGLIKRIDKSFATKNVETPQDFAPAAEFFF